METPNSILKSILTDQRSNDRPHKCPSCKYAFRSSSNLREHKNFYHSKGAVTCSQCPETFPTSNCLRRHRIQHSLYSGRCPHCRCCISNPKATWNAEVYKEKYTEHLLTCSRKPSFKAPRISTIQQAINSFLGNGSENNNRVEPSYKVTKLEETPKTYSQEKRQDNSTEQVIKHVPNISPKNYTPPKNTYEKTPRTWQCPYCSGSFKTVQISNEHYCVSQPNFNIIPSHLAKTKPLLFPSFCIVCDMKFANEEELSAHLYNMHQRIDLQEIDTSEKDLVVPKAPNVLYIVTNQKLV